jgi:hypothetical protein
MTRPLRRAHRYIWLLLGGVLPGLFAAGLAFRPPQAPDETVADRITFVLPSGTEIVADSRELWGKAVDGPDPLIYWSSAPSHSVAGRTLAGSLAHGRRAALPLPASGGYLLLYSLAHQEVLASAAVPKEMP